jgi:hypothetical protein
MRIQRKPLKEVTPEYEDRGLFKSPPTRLEVNLVPKIWKNTRGDILIRGHVFDGVAIEVLFAGRRMKTAAKLVDTIRLLWTRANQQHPAESPPLNVDSIKYPIVVNGSWRVRFETDRANWQTRHYQLIVAQWRPKDAQNPDAMLGEMPKVPRSYQQM